MNAHRALAAAAAVVLVAGCSGSVRLSGAIEGQATPTTAVVAPTPPTCTAQEKLLDATRSYEPQGPPPIRNIDQFQWWKLQGITPEQIDQHLRRRGGWPPRTAIPS